MKYPFFKNLIFKIRLAKASKSKMFVFSELSDKSFSFAKNISQTKENKGCSILFTSSVAEDRTEELGALCFEGNVSKLPLNAGLNELSFFLTGEDESAKLSDAMKLYDKYKGKKKTGVYVFSGNEGTKVTVESAASALENVKKGFSIAVIDDMQFFALEAMKKADVLTRSRGKTKNGERIISVLITDLNEKGMAILKTVLWYCRVDNCFLEVNVIDADGKGELLLERMCPEILEKNNSTNFSDAGYSIKFIKDTDFSKGGLNWILRDKGLDRSERECVERIERTSVVYVTGKEDSEILQNAIELRRLFDRLDLIRIRDLVESAGVSKLSAWDQTEKMLASEKKNGCDYPYIYACIEDPSIYEQINAFGGLKDNTGKGYNIGFAGGNNLVYSERLLEPFNMEEEYKKTVKKESAKSEDAYEKQFQTAKKIYLRTCGYSFSGSTDESSNKERAKLLNSLSSCRQAK